MFWGPSFIQDCVKDTLTGDLNFQLEVVVADVPSDQLLQHFMEAVKVTQLPVCASLLLFLKDIDVMTINQVKVIIIKVKEPSTSPA